DEGLKRVARRGQEVAAPSLAHSVHAEIGGLKPGRWYWYRFEAGGEISPVGRFKTAPAPNSKERLRIAVASCQQWTQGLYTAYQHLSEEDVDLVAHLGDYIYEQGYKGQIRQEGHAEIFTLPEYRNRHALYKSDPLLRKAHARFPWVSVWDDHEVSNNYAGDVQEKGQPRDQFLERRASGYQAYYEHMPLRRSQMAKGSSMGLYRRLDFGQLLRLNMLDTRQYRSDQPCTDGLKPACPDMHSPAQTVLGADQERWLQQGLGSSPSIWNVLGQQIFFTMQDFDPTSAEMFNMDSWSGYPLARKRMVEMLDQSNRGVVILTGDVHANWVGQVHTTPLEVNSRCVAAEFVGTSISSGGDGADMVPRAEALLPVNPQIRYYNGRRGYLRCEVTAQQWRTDYRVLDFVSKPGSPIKTAASFVVEPGNLVPNRA
ncbi:MAG TPA: alkaline phosphatase D family protein, partial [Bryobacteraceae bacterium]|nr:alkaline phosphatase D family protein [Bryobacteraceae bacterium]